MDLKDFKTITSNSLEAEKFLRGQNCLRKTAPDCRVCNRSMTLVKDRKTRIWRCPTHKSEKLSIRSGSCWENSRLDLEKLVEILFFWSRETPAVKLAEVTGISHRTALYWYQNFRDICSNWVLNNQDKVEELRVRKCKRVENPGGGALLQGSKISNEELFWVYLFVAL